MTYQELIAMIKNSSQSDWLFNDERGLYTYKNDLHLRIERRDIDHESDGFLGEKWATGHPDPTAYRVIYEVYYGASFVYERLLVSVDGHRATLPLPKINSNIVSQDDFHFAKIVDQLNTLSEYMQRSNLRVEND